MTKLVVAFERDGDVTTEELREYYREEHVPLVKELPDLQGYDVAFPRNPERSPFDGLAQLYFEDAAALGAAMDTEAAERMQADGANFLDPDSLVQFVGEEEQLLD